MATTSVLMTADEFLALPDDGVHRELIHGELREYPMTTRSYAHSWVNIRLGHILWNWLERQPKPRGQVGGGEARFRIGRDPETIVGIDLAFISAELTAQTTLDATFVDGPPLLAVEILSPSQTMEDILAKVVVYLEADVPLVWLVEPLFGTITVYRPDAEPELFNKQQEISAEPHLPGFRVAIAEIFDSTRDEVSPKE